MLGFDKRIPKLMEDVLDLTAKYLGIQSDCNCKDKRILNLELEVQELKADVKALQKPAKKKKATKKKK